MKRITFTLLFVFLVDAITHDSLLVPLLAVGGILLSNMTQEIIYKPIVISDKIKLNAFTILFSEIIGGLI